MADIASKSTRENPPLYIPQGKPMTRTRNPMRPRWLDDIRRPIRITCEREDALDAFSKAWRFDGGEFFRILLVSDLAKLSLTVPLLVLPGGEDDCSIPDFCPVKYWRAKGGPVISIPKCAAASCKIDGAFVAAHFPIETNMEAETVIAIALHRHLDGLNGK